MPENLYDLSEFHVWCVAKIINLTVEECFRIIRTKMATVLGLIAAIRSSLKRQGQFDKVKVELEILHSTISGLDVELRWSSIYEMLSRAKKVSNMVNAVRNRSTDMMGQKFSEADWESYRWLAEPLELAVCITKSRSGSMYKKLRFSDLALHKLIVKKKTISQCLVNLMRGIRSAMTQKLKSTIQWCWARWVISVQC